MQYLALSNDDIRKILSETGVIEEKELNESFTQAEKEKASLLDVIISRGLIPAHEMPRLIAESLDIRFVSLSGKLPTPEVLEYIPEVIARSKRLVPFKKDEAGLHIAMLDPTNIELINFIQRKEGFPVIAYAALSEDIDMVLELYGSGLTSILKESLSVPENENGLSGSGNDFEEDSSVIQVVKKIIVQAYRNRASDIHIEPREDGDSVIRFRIDGMLHDVAEVPNELHAQIISRVKVMSKLRTDEHQTPQDGKIAFPLEEEKLDVDIRVSIVPVLEGEKAVLRLLAERSRQFSLAGIGLSDENLKKVREAYEKPYGMLLATGPTGCGKTTTLYGVLKLLNKRHVNIMTIEDPVEYDLEGVSQIQVNPKAQLTFATGLKSILRQDPNIILVGEIRDSETAGIAVNLGLTGHLVLSTLHTNDSATAIPRLVDLGVEPFLIASTVNAVIAQRLVRKIHENCRVSEKIPAENVATKIGWDLTKKIFGVSKSKPRSSIDFYRGKGCDACQGTGYQGRIGIFEVLIIDDEIRQAIAQNKDAGFIQDLAEKAGMINLMEDGLEKVKMGTTTIDEILSATKL